jgi:hypothetical protein
LRSAREGANLAVSSLKRNDPARQEMAGKRTPLQGPQGHAEGMKMTMAQDILAQLQPGFEALAPLVREWALPTEQQRCNKRLSTALPDLRLFNDAVFPRMKAVLRYLSDIPGDDPASLPPPTHLLHRLALSYFEIPHPLELRWKGVDLDDAFPAARLVHRAPGCTEN